MTLLFVLLTFFAWLAAGAAAGWLHFRGLWWTIAYAGETSRPSLVYPASFLVRSGVTLGILFLALVNGHITGLFACLTGLYVVRRKMVLKIRPQTCPF
jgi:F1F0 ATPase subunit 2